MAPRFLIQAETLASQALQRHAFLFFLGPEMKNYLDGPASIE